MHRSSHPLASLTSFICYLLKRPWQALLLLASGLPLAWAAGVSINNVVITTVKQLSFAQASVQVNVGAQYTQTATVRLSPGAVSYLSSNPQVAKVDAQTGRVSALLPGEATITANQVAASPYPAATASYSFKVKGDQAVFNPWALDPVVFGTVTSYPIKPATVQNSQGAITYRVADQASAALVDVTPTGVVTLKAAGKATLVASVAAHGTVGSGSTLAVLDIQPGAHTFSWPHQAVTLGSTLALKPPTDSPSQGIFSYQVLPDAQNQVIATLNGNVLTPSRLGTTTIKVTQAPYGNYTEASRVVNLTVVANNTSTVNLVDPPEQPYNARFKPQISTNSDAAVQLVSLTPDIVEINGSEVHVIGVGTAVIRASVAKTDSYPAAEDTATFKTVRADPFLNMNDLSRPVASEAFQLPLTTRSNGLVSISSEPAGLVSIAPAVPPGIAPSVKAGPNAGKAVLTLQQAETPYYNAAKIVRTLELVGQVPTITWNIPSYYQGSFGSDTVTLPPATSNSPGALSYSAVYAPAQAWSGEAVSFVDLVLSVPSERTSRVILTVKQAAHEGFASAEFSAQMVVTRKPNPDTSGLAETTLAVATGLPHKVSDGPFRLSTSSTSSAPIELEKVTGPYDIVSGPVENGQPTWLIKPLQAGTAKIKVFQQATSTHKAALVEADFLITSELEPIQKYESTTVVLDASNAYVSIPEPASLSAGAYTFTVDNAGIAEIVGQQLKLKQAGTTRITATQAANGIYGLDNAVADLTVLHQPNTLAFPLPAMAPMTPESARYFSVRASSNSPATIRYSSSNPTVATITDDGMATLTGVAGSTVFTAVQDVSPNNWYASARATAALTVQPVSSGLRLAGYSLPLNATDTVPPYQTNSPSREVIVSTDDPAIAEVDPANPKRLILHKAGQVLVTVMHPAIPGGAPEASASAFLTITAEALTLSGLPANIHHVWTGASPPPTTLTPAPAGNYVVTTSNANVATVNGMQVTLTGVGDAYLTVTRNADNASPATSVTIPVRVEAQSPSGARLPMLALGDQVLSSTTQKILLKASSDNTATKISYAITEMNPPGIASIDAQGQLWVMGAGTVKVKASQEANLPTFQAHSVTATVLITNGLPLFHVTYAPTTVKPGEVFEYRYITNDHKGTFIPKIYPGGLQLVSLTAPAAPGQEGLAYFRVDSQIGAADLWIGVLFESPGFPNNIIDSQEENAGVPPWSPPARSVRVDPNGSAQSYGRRLEGPLDWKLGAQPNNPDEYGNVPRILNTANQVVGECATYRSEHPNIAQVVNVVNARFLAHYSSGKTTLYCEEDPSLRAGITVLGKDTLFGEFAAYTLTTGSRPVTITPPISNNPEGTWTYQVVSNTGLAGLPAVEIVNGQLVPKSEGEAVIRATQSGGAFTPAFIDTSVTVKPSLIKDFGNVTVTFGDQDFTMPRPNTGDTTTPITYSIDKPNVATIDAQSGLVKIVGAGTATVTATQGSQSAASQLTVQRATPRLSFGVPSGTYLYFSGCQQLSLLWPRANQQGYPSDNTWETVPGASLSTNSNGQLAYITSSALLGWGTGDQYHLGIKRPADWDPYLFKGHGIDNAVPFLVWVHQAENENFFSATSAPSVIYGYITDGYPKDDRMVYGCTPNN